MRLKSLIINEARLLLKYGIIYVYIIFTVVYLCLIAIIPTSAKAIMGTVLIFTDPAAMGLFFMGAMLLFEKSQRVESSLGVSPIKTGEYIAAKLLPVMMIGILVSLVIALFSGVSNLLMVIVGVALSSNLFSLCGLIVGARIKTLNGFMMATVPFEIIICVPAILYLFDILNGNIWLMHPGIAAIRLIQGESLLWWTDVISLVLWCVPIYLEAVKSVKKSFSEMGGAKI